MLMSSSYKLDSPTVRHPPCCPVDHIESGVQDWDGEADPDLPNVPLSVGNKLIKKRKNSLKSKLK